MSLDLADYPAKTREAITELSEMTNLKTFIATLAGHMAAEAARNQPMP